MIYTNQTQTVYFSQGSGGGYLRYGHIEKEHPRNSANCGKIQHLSQHGKMRACGRLHMLPTDLLEGVTHQHWCSDFVSHTLIQLWDLYRLIIKYWPFLMLGDSSRCLLLPQANLALNGERLKGMNHPRMTSQEPSHLKTLKSGWSSLTSLLINFQGR